MTMEKYISESRAFYEENWHGQFSSRLAEWAIGKMQTKDGKGIKVKPIDEVLKLMKEYGAELPDKHKYTVWYLYHMAVADYPAALQSEETRAYFVYETLKDPDGCPANTLDCFVTKMCNAGEPIDWEAMV